ncbi:MAG TPA: hypothetical protein VNX68_16075 [Nitrosopumilaceae archaeon]|jgi:hypothetical protein|nr:hypothetical protein [Nitrosopumilaceae archaeon]
MNNLIIGNKVKIQNYGIGDWDGITGTIYSKNNNIIYIHSLVKWDKGDAHCIKGSLLGFPSECVFLEKDSIYFKIGDVVEVFGWTEGWNGVIATIIEVKKPDDIGNLYKIQVIKSRNSVGVGAIGRFYDKYLRLINQDTKITKLKLKSSGHTVRIIESKDDKVRFLVIESNSESDWILKTQLDKETVIA